MSTLPPSPKRRRILGSINPDGGPKRHRRAAPEARPPRHDAATSPRPPHAARSAFSHVANEAEEPVTVQPRATRLKLKSDRTHRRGPRHAGPGGHSPSPSHRHHRRERRRGHRHPRSESPPGAHDPAPLDREAAFRESLFDAMADEEGADYWEAVYGQPVHVYPNERFGPTGELEQMTDDDYAAYVRQKMWEKTHAGLLEERARRQEAQKQTKEEERHNRRLQEEMEESLRKGEERRKRKQALDLWEKYARAWAKWDGSVESLSWPVASGRRHDITEDDVRAFFVNGLELALVGETAFLSKLRDERIRWHPDKIQQRCGGSVDQAVMRDVTAVFQIIDRLWSQSRRV